MADPARIPEQKPFDHAASAALIGQSSGTIEAAASGRPLRVLLVGDGRLGHVHQSEGVIAALKQLGPVDESRVSVRRRRLVPGRLARRLARIGGLRQEPLLRLIYPAMESVRDRPDLIVSSGGDTLAANVLLARRFGADNIFSGGLRGLPAELFTLVLAIDPRLAGNPRHFVGLKPSPFDPKTMPSPRPIRSVGDLRGTALGLLVGGPSGSHAWTTQDWGALANLVRDSVAEHGSTWRIATSPRTPADALAPLAALAGETRHVDLAVFGAPATSPIAYALAADALVVSEDSTSMIADAIQARRPVVALVPARRSPSVDDAALDAWEAEGWLARLPGGTTPAALAQALASQSAERPDFLAALAQELASRLPVLRR